jgi:hypothetical protein
MILDIDKYSDFCNENDELRHIKSRSYPIDHVNFEKWIMNHQEGLPRDTARRFRDATRHVSFDEFLSKYKQICDEIIDHIHNKQYDTVILLAYVDENLAKSNFWLALYMFPFLKDNVQIVITNAYDLHTIMEINMNKTLLILPDDASYSGTQIADIIEEFTDESDNETLDRLDIIVAVGYISQKAIEKIKSKTSHLNICIPSVTEYFERFDIPQEMYPFKGNQKVNLLHTLYFDHKLPDAISIYQPMYAIGKGFGKVDIDYTYEPMSLIDGCEVYKYLEIDPYRIVSNREFVTDLKSELKKGAKMCPNPIYKEFQYMYRSKPIYHIDELEITINHVESLMPTFWHVFQKFVDQGGVKKIRDLSEFKQFLKVADLCKISIDVNDKNKIKRIRLNVTDTFDKLKNVDLNIDPSKMIGEIFQKDIQIE